MADLVRQQGDIQVRLTYMDEKGQSESMVTVSATINGLRLISGNTAKHWEDSTLMGHIANCRAPQKPNFETQVLLPIVGADRELGARQGLTIAEGRRSKPQYAVADVQNRCIQPYPQMVKAPNYSLARESNTAVFGGPPAEGRGAVPTRGAHMSGRAARRTPHLRMPADGGNTRPYQLHGLMAGGLSVSTAQPNLTGGRRQVNNRRPRGCPGRTHLPRSMPLPSRTSRL
ncbi:peptide hydrolase, partial [Trypanosoma cruzi]